MEESISVMNRLLQECEKEPLQNQKKEYYRAIYQLINEEGFSGTVQEYLGKGFKFVKMGPFKAYFVRQDDHDKTELLNQLFNSDILKKDKIRAFTALMNLLALFFSSRVERLYCSAVVGEILKYSYNKEGKIIGSAGGIMMNSFYSELTIVPTDYKYEKLFANIETRNRFDELMASSISYAKSVRKLTVRQKDAVEIMRKWIYESENPVQNTKQEKPSYLSAGIISNDSSGDQMKNPALEQKDEGSLSEKAENVQIGLQPADISATEEEGQHDTAKHDQISEINESATVDLTVLLEQLQSKLDRVNLAVEKSVGNTELIIKTQQSYLTEFEKTIEMEKNNSELIRTRNIELTETVNNLQKRNEELRKQIIEKEEEMKSLNALLEVSAKERDRKFNEEILKLTDKLRFEYQDYMTVKNIAMSIDLGENMRGQLGDVFDILKKAGFDIDIK